MQLSIGIIIGLLIATLILVIESRLSIKKTSITKTILKATSSPPEQGHIIEEQLSDKDINKLIHE